MKILLVEDHADIRRLVRMTLEYESCEIREASHVEEAEAVLRDFEPDLILLDVMMPGPRNGLDLCRSLRADPRKDGVRIVMLSALDGLDDQMAGLAAGANDYLIKPFSPLQLLEMLCKRPAAGAAAGPQEAWA
ncbi:response regulator transcription factor [Inhella sp.]|uniref:response regulator transcription factor n=1 Tax=Inhella sp. TaxID=1921806 RepID=UPI0035ADAE04